MLFPVDEFLQTIEVMNMIEKYYTAEQLDYLTKRREEGGTAMEAVIQQAPQMWADLFAAVSLPRRGWISTLRLKVLTFGKLALG
jgi:hypothetical protein